MKKIIVTGCNGQLGRAINAQYAGSTEYELVNTDVEDLDITDVEAVLAHVREVKPYEKEDVNVRNKENNNIILFFIKSSDV